MTDTHAERRRRIRHQLPLLVSLVLLWMLLWSAFTWLGLVTGVMVAIIVTRVFYLPAIEFSGRFNPWLFLRFLGRFAGGLIVGSFQVAVTALRPRGVRQNAVLAIQLVTRSDLILTLTAIAISLLPGSIVVEVDREKAILYVHALDTPDTAAVDRVRSSVLATEASLVRALGSRTDLTRIIR